jgi:hypothetical protein
MTGVGHAGGRIYDAAKHSIKLRTIKPLRLLILTHLEMAQRKIVHAFPPPGWFCSVNIYEPHRSNESQRQYSKRDPAGLSSRVRTLQQFHA